MIPEDIQKGIDISIEVLRRQHSDFNPYNDSTYDGLCNEACDIFLQVMKKVYNKDGKLIHGELRHNSKVNSENWNIEHTWIKYNGYYIDFTCGQFRNLIKTIPSQYVSRVSPKWFIRDKYNLSIKNDLFAWLLYRIKAPICNKINKARGGSNVRHK